MIIFVGKIKAFLRTITRTNNHAAHCGKSHTVQQKMHITIKT